VNLAQDTCPCKLRGSNPGGCSSAWQSTSFATRGPRVQIPPAPLNTLVRAISERPSARPTGAFMVLALHGGPQGTCRDPLIFDEVLSHHAAINPMAGMSCISPFPKRWTGSDRLFIAPCPVKPRFVWPNLSTPSPHRLKVMLLQLMCDHPSDYVALCVGGAEVDPSPHPRVDDFLDGLREPIETPR
jgi:hypothetical protein